ncbi:MAG: hypothetical protein JWQ53_657 [Klenkia sp.]|nr:hypothetical protein [Klenkia sp.]
MTVPSPSPDSDCAAGSPPVVHPGMRGLPDRAAIREVALHAEPGALVLTRAGRELRRLRVGPGAEVEQALHLGGPVLGDVAPDMLGAIDLVDGHGGRVARLDLGDWVPEADELTTSAEALRRSGLGSLLERAGLPVRPVPASQLADALRAAVPPLLPLRRMPVAFTALRSVAVVVAVAALIVAVVGDVPDLLWQGAGFGLLLSTIAGLALWLSAAARDRIVDGDHPVLRPHPSTPVTRRFCRVARLRVEPDVVVVIDGLGRERRLPRLGALAVTTAAVVRDGTDRAQVELRTASGVPRATLPCDQWCAGHGGDAALSHVCAAGGLALERGSAPARRPQAEEERARQVFSSHDNRTVARTMWPHGLPGAAAVWQTAAFAWLLLLYSFSDDPPAFTRAMLGTAGALALLPHLARLAVRRFWLDVPMTDDR